MQTNNSLEALIAPRQRETPLMEKLEKAFFSSDVKLLLHLSVSHCHMSTEKIVEMRRVRNNSASFKTENRQMALLCMWEYYIMFLSGVSVKPYFFLYLKVSHTKQVMKHPQHSQYFYSWYLFSGREMLSSDSLLKLVGPLGKQWSHHLWSCSRTVEMWH